MYLDLAIYINNLPAGTRFLVYFAMIISIPLLLWLNNVIDKRQEKKSAK